MGDFDAILLLSFLLGAALVWFGVRLFRRKRRFLGAWVVVISLPFFAVSSLPWALSWLFQPSRYIYYVEHILSPDNKGVFALYESDCGIGDMAWHVFKLENGVNPSSLSIPSDCGDASEEERNRWDEKVLFWNYSEDGSHTEDPHIRIIKGKYLVLSRGGLYHSAYDIESGKVAINYECPWCEFNDSDKYMTSDTLQENQKAYKEWAKEHLDTPIKRLLQ